MLRLLLLLIFIEGFACNKNQVPPVCESQEQMKKYLTAIETKLSKFNTINVERLDGIADQQLFLQSRLDGFEATEKVTHIKLDDLKSMLELRPTLDALMTMLVSTEKSLNETRDELLAEIAQLALTLKNRQHRINGQPPLQDGRESQFASAVASPPLDSSKTAMNCLDASVGIVQLQLTPFSDPFFVSCERDGWLVVMNRLSDNLNFERDWLEYKAGFGNFAGEFFIGLEKLHALTAFAVHELRVELEDANGRVATAGYRLFGIAGEKESYALNLLGSFDNGNAGDSLTYHAGSKFSTFDNDNDGCLGCNCAASHKGGWWFHWCAESNLMGNYEAAAQDAGLMWKSLSARNFLVHKAKMLIRPVGVH